MKKIVIGAAMTYETPRNATETGFKCPLSLLVVDVGRIGAGARDYLPAHSSARRSGDAGAGSSWFAMEDRSRFDERGCVANVGLPDTVPRRPL